MKTRYFKVTTESRKARICGVDMVESRVDVQELAIDPQPEGMRADERCRVNLVGAPQRACDKISTFEIQKFREQEQGLGASIWRHLQENVFSFFLLDDFIEGFRKAVK
jgi:hypothetical protein